MSLKKKLVLAVAAAAVASSASAVEKGPTVTLGGTLDTQLGAMNQKNAFNDTNPVITVNSVNAKQRKFNLVNSTEVDVMVSGKAHGLTYGGVIGLNADTSASKVGSSDTGRKTFMFVESAFGKMEAGSTSGAYTAMAVNGATNAHATGGVNGDWRYWANQSVSTNGGTLIFKPGLVTSVDSNKTDFASKVNFYSPTYSGFKLGLTYTPDTDQYGTVNHAMGVSKTYVTSAANNLKQTFGFKNVFQGGLNYHGKFDKIGFKFAALGEFGKAKDFREVGGLGTDTAKRKDLRAFEIGAGVHYMGMSLNGSWGDWGKSGQMKSVTRQSSGVTKQVTGGKNGSFWTLGAAYDHNHFGASVNYMGSKNGGFASAANTPSYATPAYATKKGEAQVYSFGLDYKLAPGFLPYAEITHFTLKDKNVAASKNTGNVFLAGSKLTF